MIYIATFYSHFGAIRFKKMCTEIGVKSKVMPVPRNLSSSCGTCVRYESKDWNLFASLPEEVEQIVEINQSNYIEKYKAENS